MYTYKIRMLIIPFDFVDLLNIYIYIADTIIN